MDKRYDIHVDAWGNCKVTPSVARLKKGEDTASFTSNNPETCIRYGNASPFGEAEIGPNTILAIGTGNGKQYKAVNIPGNYHFDCGFLNEGGAFTSYTYTPAPSDPIPSARTGQIASASSSRIAPPPSGGADTDIDP